MRVCWMLSSAGEARIAVPAAAAMAEQGITSVFASWLTECVRFLHDSGVRDPVYAPRELPPPEDVGPDALEVLDRRFPVPGLAALAYAEARARYLGRRDDVVPLAAQYLRFWERFLAEHRIAAALLWTSSNVACRSLWSVAQARGLPALVIGSGPTFDHFSLADRGEETVWSELVDALAQGPRPLDEETRQEVLRVVAQVTARHSQFKPRPTGLLPADLVGRLKRTPLGRLGGSVLRALDLRKPTAPRWVPSAESVARFPDDPAEQAMFRHLYRHIERRRTGWTWLTRTGLLDYGRVDDERRYVYFPMQQEVGARLAGQYPAYADQIALAEQIARVVPPGCQLVVKEHPTHPGLYDWRRLRGLQSLSNVVVVHPHTDNARLIERARALIVVSSTAGWEAFLARVPVVALGRTFYACSDLVFFVPSIHDLPRALRAALDAGRGLYERRYDEWLWFIHQTLVTSNPGSAFGYKKLFEVLEAKEESNGTLMGRRIAAKLQRMAARNAVA